MVRPRASHHRWALLVALSACGETPSAPAPEPTTTPTAAPETAREEPFPPASATPMDAQLRALDALSLAADDGVPVGVDPAIWNGSVPAGNETTPARVALGRKLYFDPRLSADGSVACATCHDTTRGFVDHRNASEGIGGQVGRRNAPTTLNAALLETQFLDGRSASLEEQAELPIQNPIEMGQPSEEATVAAIADDAEYQRMFQEAYGRAPNFEDLARAIAAFERTLVLLDAPFDRFMAGDEDAITTQAKAGWVLFNEKARCVTCHSVSPSNPVFTDHKFHNIGVAARHQNFGELAMEALAALASDASEEAIDQLALASDSSELGRFLITRAPADIGAFKTSQLRNIGVTAPYMHDGSLQTLWDVVDHYNKGGEANAHLDGGMVPLALSEVEIDQLVAFMFTLTSNQLSELNEREQARQRGVAQTQRPFRDDDLAHRRTLPFAPEGGIEGGGA